jgi:transcriptional regulator with XRE-family HTH domain
VPPEGGHLTALAGKMAGAEHDEHGRAAEALLGQNVRRLREALGLSLREVSRRSGVAVSLVSRVEQGQGTSVRIAARLADGLGVTLPALLSEVEDCVSVPDGAPFFVMLDGRAVAVAPQPRAGSREERIAAGAVRP